jgi:hypothetical protein
MSESEDEPVAAEASYQAPDIKWEESLSTVAYAVGSCLKLPGGQELCTIVPKNT